ncbi:MAG: DUF2797 domain-containing protein [Pseudomonadales bacterium]
MDFEPLEGYLERMAVAPGDAAAPASYQLVLHARPGPGTGAVDATMLALDGLLGAPLAIEFLGDIACCYCGRRTRKSFGQGYCYPCFQRLARCDLCVVSPDRCHYAAGTCREPEWGVSFCMQPHLVYLANSAGAKVGLTRRGQELGRWLDQGATQGLVILEAPTRQLAGLAEVALARHLSDRTDWRALVRGDAPPLDLAALRDRLRGAALELPTEVRWLEQSIAHTLRYPLLRYGTAFARWRLERQTRVEGTLLGIKGQFLLFDRGVLNIRQHRAYRVRVSSPASGSLVTADQMEMFE